MIAAFVELDHARTYVLLDEYCDAMGLLQCTQALSAV
jgi:hypothetical protein